MMKLEASIYLTEYKIFNQFLKIKCSILRIFLTNNLYKKVVYETFKIGCKYLKLELFLYEYGSADE